MSKSVKKEILASEYSSEYSSEQVLAVNTREYRLLQKNTTHKKDLKFALVVELAQLKFTYVIVASSKGWF